MKRPKKPRSKADQIRALLATGMTSMEIGRRVGCHDAYVRAVRLRQDDRYRAADNEACRVLRKTCDREAVAYAARHAYRAARDEGATIRDAALIALRVRSRVTRETGDRAAANRAWRKARVDEKHH